MEQLRDTPLLAAISHLDHCAVIGENRQWTWREVHTDSMTLALRLEPRAAVFNLCNSRIGFLVAWLAALRRGCLQLLPPSGGLAELTALLQSTPDPVVVVDDPQALQPDWARHARCLVHVPGATSRAATNDDLAWSPPWDAPLVRLYTSGSTGTPEPQVKTLGHLAQGALVLARRLDTSIAGGRSALGRIVCSVPPQHMFGLETSVMLPLVIGVPVLDRRPLLPADIGAALESGSDAAAWVATPLHLRAVAQAGQALPRCGAVIASTMPLASDLAARVEALSDAPVLEIYGSTETGVVAMRRTAHDTRWRAVAEVRLQAAEDGTRVWGSHFPSPRTLPDRMEIRSDGDFVLLGRQGDLIKVGGRRASLAGLNLLLQGLPGLADGVFYLPATGAPTERLLLIYAGPELDRRVAQAWLRQHMDPAFLPRAFIRTEQLPRAGAGKLPRAALDRLYGDWLARKGAA